LTQIHIGCSGILAYFPAAAQELECCGLPNLLEGTASNGGHVYAKPVEVRSGCKHTCPKHRI
jgi:hypothetical protein